MRHRTIIVALAAMLVTAIAVGPALADSPQNTTEVRENTYPLRQYRTGCDERVYITGTLYRYQVIRTNAAGTSIHNNQSWNATGVGLTTGMTYDVRLVNTSMSSGHDTIDNPRALTWPAQWTLWMVPEDSPPQIFHGKSIIVFHDYGTPDEWVSSDVWHRTDNC